MIDLVEAIPARLDRAGATPTMIGRATAEDAPHLVALQPEARPADFGLDDAGCTLGRGQACQVIVPRPAVSRLHALIERTGARFQLRDLGSLNGTYVNGQRLRAPHLLINYDLIGLGETCPQLTFVDPDSTHATATRLG
jgi:pSer/pThr/pTyr-binding forkhead associated (FHA) protein